MQYGTEYAGHTPHNDNGVVICRGDAEPWPCAAVRALTDDCDDCPPTDFDPAGRDDGGDAHESDATHEAVTL